MIGQVSVDILIFNAIEENDILYCGNIRIVHYSALYPVQGIFVYTIAKKA